MVFIAFLPPLTQDLNISGQSRDMDTEIINIKKDLELLKKAVEELKIAVDIEPEVRSEYIEKLRKIERNGKWINFNSVDELRESMENA